MLRPLNKNVILKKDEEEKKTASGIILTESAKDKPSVATVVAIGKECEAKIKEQDRVVYKEYSGTKVKMDEVEYIIIEDEDILAVVE
ncbi:MAG: co-chaperone GroES [Erysipelotrichaceae bacterium]|nr:co-chaperone GroES [Erysipelotrichaceae bacterium]MCI9312247.1 co-chaperone GroES [Erysipelotrichaceae bacterium]